MEKAKQIEGYWSETPPNTPRIISATRNGITLTKELPARKSQFPWPKPNVLTDIQAKEIYNLIKIKENTAECFGYMGWTKSRITGENMGNREYETDGWVWPEDFAPHYVLKHKVKPTDVFLEYIGYEKI